MTVTADTVSRHVLAGLRGESEEGLEPLDGDGAESTTDPGDAAGSQTLRDDAANVNTNSSGGDATVTNTGASDAGNNSLPSQQNVTANDATHGDATNGAAPASLGSDTLNDIFGSANATFETATANNQTGAIALSDDALVTVNGQTMKFGEYKAFGKPKADFDRERTELLQKERELERNAKIVETVLPHVEAVQNDPYMRTYADTVVSLRASGIPEAEARSRAHAAAAAASGFAPATATHSAPQVDPRLVPPKDEHGNDLALDDPRYLQWYGSDERISAIATRQTTALLSEADQKRQREEAQRQASADAQRQKQQEEQDFHESVFRRNKETLAKLPDVLRAKGVDLTKVPRAAFNDATSQLVDRAVSYGKDLRDDNWLRHNLLQPGDLAALVDASGIAERLKMNPTGMTQTANGGANGAAANTHANGQAAGVSNAGQTVNAGANGAAVDTAAGRLRMQKQPANRPLNAGGPSEVVPNQQAQRDETQDSSYGWKAAYEGLH